MPKITVRATITVILLVSLVFASCDVGSALFTKEELDSMYVVELTQEGRPLDDGARLAEDTSLAVAVSSVNGAPEPASLYLELTSSSGSIVASIVFSSVDAADGSIVVEDLYRDIPPFSLPDDLEDGYYVLQASVRDASDAVLSTYSTALLVYAGSMPTPALAVYPGKVNAGGVSLLKLEADYPDGTDPWIRWTIDGTVRAVGLVSERADRVAWEAPKANGVYVARAELFPFEPPVGFDVTPLSTADIRLPLSAVSGSPDAYESLDAWTRLALNGNYKDSGIRQSQSEPVGLGEPYLETYPAGFGFHLGAGAGLVSASSLLPVDESTGLPRAFTAVFTIAPAVGDAPDGDGVLLIAQGTDGVPSLTIGVRGGIPFVSSRGDSALASSGLPSRATRLAVYVSPVETGAAVSFYIDENPAGSGFVPSGLFGAVPGACTIAGDDGYKAVYDEVRVMAGAYPAYYLAEATRLGPSLLVASGFEGGVPGRGIVTEGPVKPGRDSLTLLTNSKLIAGDADLPEDRSFLWFDLVAGEVTVSMALESGKTLSIGSNGNVAIYDDATDQSDLSATFSVFDGGRFAVGLERTDSGAILYGGGDEQLPIPYGLAPGARWVISPDPGSPATIRALTLAILEVKTSAQSTTSQDSLASADDL